MFTKYARLSMVAMVVAALFVSCSTIPREDTARERIIVRDADESTGFWQAVVSSVLKPENIAAALAAPVAPAEVFGGIAVVRFVEQFGGVVGRLADEGSTVIVDSYGSSSSTIKRTDVTIDNGKIELKAGGIEGRAATELEGLVLDE